MPGQYSRLHTWSSGEILTASDLNGEFNNELANAVPSSIDDYSSNATQMQSAVDPGEVGTESLATTLAGEIERLRYAIKEVKGTAQWYETASTDLANVSNPNDFIHIGLEFEGRYGGASSTTDVLAKLINQGAVINSATLTAADVVVADFDATNKKFGAYAYSLGAGNILAFPGKYGNPIKGSLSAWYRNLAAGDYIAYNPLLGVEVFLEGGAGKQSFRITEKTSATDSTKESSLVEGTATRSADTTFRNITCKWRLNDEGGIGTDLMEMEYGGTDEGTQLSTQNIDINAGDGGFWFIGAKKNQPSAWDHFYAAAGSPTAHSSPWTASGSPTISGGSGQVKLTTAASTSGDFSRTGAPLAGVNLAAQTFTIKCRCNTLGASDSINTSPQFLYEIRDDSMNRRVRLHFFEYKVSVMFGESTSNNNVVAYEAYINTKEWHTYWVTCTGSPSPVVRLYIDGVLVYVGTNATVDTTANDSVIFGDSNSSVATGIDVDIEYVAYADEVAAPVAASSQGQIDSLGVTSGNVPDIVISRLQTIKVTEVFKELPSHGPYLPPRAAFDRINVAISTTSTNYADFSNWVYYVGGDGVTEYNFNFNASVDNNAANNNSYVNIDIDNDLTGTPGGSSIANPGSFVEQAVGLTSQNLNAVAQRTVILSTGFHEVRPNFAVDAGTCGVQESQVAFERSVNGLVRLQ